MAFITFTTRNHGAVAVNTDHIRYMVETPDGRETVLCLTPGDSEASDALVVRATMQGTLLQIAAAR